MRQAARCTAALASLLAACAAPGEPRHAFSHAAMGTRFDILVHAADQAEAERAARAAFARIDQLDSLLSDYRPDSELNLVSARSAGGAPTGPIPVSEDLWRVLVAAQDLAERSAGAFDVTVGPFVRLWRRAARQGELPSHERLQQAARSVGHRKLRLDPRSRTVELLAPDMRLDLGGIAKGFALDEAMAVLHTHGIAAALVDGGGDLLAGPAPPGSAGWRVQLVVPEGVPGTPERLLVHGAAVATSGDLYRHVEIAGVRYSHLVDPRTGLGLTDGALVTVIAPDGMSADALASAASVLGADAGLALLEAVPGVEGRILQVVHGALRECRTSGFPGAMPYSGQSTLVHPQPAQP